MAVCRRVLVWIVGLVALSGCVGSAAGSNWTSPGSIVLPLSPSGLGPVFDVLAARPEAPSLAEVEHMLGASTTAVSRPDRYEEAVFSDGTRFVRVTPAPPDGRPRLDTGPMAALRFSGDLPGVGCLPLDELRSRLIVSGWISPPTFAIERHGGGGVSSQDPWMLSRHDYHLRLYLFPARNGCLSGYALLWNLDISGLTQLRLAR